MKDLAYLKTVGAAVFLALAAYAAAAGMELAESSATVTAEYVSVSDSIETEGSVHREEILVPGKGLVKLLVADGERVPRGSVVAKRGKKEIIAPQAGFFSSENAPDNAVGRVVCALSWQYETTLKSGDCDKLRLGDRVTLRTDCGDFEAVVSEKSGCRVRFTSKRGIEKLLCVDTLSAQVICGEESGLCVPASALRHGEDGDFVTVRTGELERRAAVRVVGEFEDGLLVEGELRPGMEVVY